MGLYQTTPLPFFAPGMTTSAGYTTRQMLAPVSTYSGSRVYQTYVSTVMLINVNGQWASDLSDVNPRADVSRALPYEVYKIYVLNSSSPDGDVAFRPGDQFIPNSNLVGLVSNTVWAIRGYMPNSVYAELIIERKL